MCCFCVFNVVVWFVCDLVCDGVWCECVCVCIFSCVLFVRFVSVVFEYGCVCLFGMYCVMM